MRPAGETARAPRQLSACRRRWTPVEKQNNDWVLLEALCERHRPKDSTPRK
jgi:hypothetical protein